MGTAKRLTSTFLVLGLLILGSYGKALAEPASPPDETRGFNPALWLVNLYRDHLSPIDGDRCPSFPPPLYPLPPAVRRAHGPEEDRGREGRVFVG